MQDTYCFTVQGRHRTVRETLQMSLKIETEGGLDETLTTLQNIQRLAKSSWIILQRLNRGSTQLRERQQAATMLMLATNNTINAPVAAGYPSVTAGTVSPPRSSLSLSLPGSSGSPSPLYDGDAANDTASQLTKPGAFLPFAVGANGLTSQIAQHPSRA